MDSFKETRRQILFALLGIAVVFTTGVMGFHFIEGFNFLDALWLTTITLTTVGYGDIYAQSTLGRFFTIGLVLSGFGVVAFGLQATATFLVSREIQEFRDRRHIRRIISQLERHYIICGEGELVNQCIAYLLQSVQKRLAFYDDELYGPIDRLLDGLLGDDDLGHYPRFRALIRNVYLVFTRPLKRVPTLLDRIVVVTQDEAYARTLREQGFLVIEGLPTDDKTLLAAGVNRARAMMVMLPTDQNVLLTVLTARSQNANLYITASTLQDDLAPKILRVGANHVIRPFELAGLFLNNVTLRPVVYDFFNGILFDPSLNIQASEVPLLPGCGWVGKRIGDLNLRGRLDATIVGLRNPSETFVVAPSDSYILSEGEVLVVIAPAKSVAAVHTESLLGTTQVPIPASQRRVETSHAPISPFRYSLEQATQAIAGMSKHFIICGTDQVALNAIAQLDPTRPFVIICDDPAQTERLIERGFRVIQGDPTHDATLMQAGVDRALAIMIALKNEGDTILTVISARSLSRHILITATAPSEEMLHKMERAGADRIIRPFNIAAQFVLLSTTRPTVSSFFSYVLYNYAAGIETTELYMEDNSPWIGKTIEDLRLDRIFRAHVIGVRQANGQFVYAPQVTHEIKAHEVLVIVTPMAHSDELRLTAHGSQNKRPDTLRQPSVIETAIHPNPLISN
ncbi:MAG: potassium channel family protein [Phototrophicaceae bacterium]|jgi:voltage-gated potassium channel